MTTTPIVQFGTSRFLQAHADLFVSEALEKGEALGKITIVQTTGSVERAGRLTALLAPDGFPVIIRGLAEGAEIDRTQQIRSVARALSTAADWDEIKRIVARESGGADLQYRRYRLCHRSRRSCSGHSRIISRQAARPVA